MGLAFRAELAAVLAHDALAAHDDHVLLQLVEPPHALEQHFAAEHNAGVGGEQVQHLELMGRQVDRSAVAMHLPARSIHAQGAGRDDLQPAAKADPWLVTRYYEMRLLDYMGFRPQLFECANCRNEIKAEDQFFSFSAGGAICPRCGHGLPTVRNISVETLKYLRHFQRSSYAEASRARPSPEIQQEAETLMQGYFTYLLERELNAPGFLRRADWVSVGGLFW